MACVARHECGVMVDEVTLRDVDSDDIPIFFEQQRDPVASALADFPARSWDAHASHWARILDDATILTQTILVDGRVAGNVVSFVQDEQREVGYWLARDYWGRGIATEALSAFLTLEQRRPIYGHVARANTASRRVLEKCGFSLVQENLDSFLLVLQEHLPLTAVADHP